MGDQITSTDRSLAYVVRFTPGGERFIVLAGNAVTAQNKGIGLATLQGVNTQRGIDVYAATEDDLDHPDVVVNMIEQEEEEEE